MKNNLLKNIINKAIETHLLTQKEIINLLENNEINEYLFSSANEVRKKFIGDEVHLRGLIEISNICKQNCKYCGIRKDNSNINRYKLTPEEIIKYSQKASVEGYKTIVLQSGESSTYSNKEICEIISEIKKFDIAVTLSLGEKTFEEYKMYKEAGANRYLLRIETTDENLYKEMHPNMDFSNRKNCLYNLKKLKYEVGTGSLVGLKGQTLTSIANDILFFKAINADMIGIGPFIKAENTPLEKEKDGDFWLALKVISIIRILMPKINIPATTAMESLIENGRYIALNAGANVIMPNVNIFDYKKDYSIYSKKVISNSSISTERKNIIKNLKKIGRCVSSDFGQSKNFKL